MNLSFTLCSRRFRDGFVAFCALTLATLSQALAQTPVVTKILDQGNNATHLNIVMFSEGYTGAELTSKFPTDAQTLLTAFFKVKPYSEYKPYFNAYTVAVASNQSGSDHQTPSVVLKDTYFNSTFDSYNTQRLVTIPPNDIDGAYADGQGKIDTLLMNYVPDYDLVMVVVNDSVYGGSGGQVLVASLNNQSAEVLIHESGHTLGGLGDEYSDSYPGFPDTEEPNTTTQTNRALIKWKSWILASTPIPTPDVTGNGSIIGLFQGAHYHPTGWYRPKQDCRMLELGVDFCEVCAEDLVLSIYGAVRPIDSFLPVNLSVSAGQGQSVAFSVVKKVPVTHALGVQWSVDGVPVTGATGNSFSISTLGIGTHNVTVAVSDPTTFVRTDTANVLKDSKVWTVQITAQPTVPVINSAVTASAQVTQAFSYQITTSMGNATSYGATGLPGGVSINAASGLLSGIPTQAGTFSVSLTATNATGTGTATLTVTVTVKPNGAAPTQPFFTGQVALSNGVYYLALPNGNPFGYYSYLADPHYIYHFDLGYEYVFDNTDGNGGVYFYDFKSQDFLYTSPGFSFPYLYDFGLKSVVYYYPDPTSPGHYNTNGVRYFYVFNTGQIISK